MINYTGLKAVFGFPESKVADWPVEQKNILVSCWLNALPEQSRNDALSFVLQDMVDAECSSYSPFTQSVQSHEAFMNSFGDQEKFTKAYRAALFDYFAIELDQVVGGE